MVPLSTCGDASRMARDVQAAIAKLLPKIEISHKKVLLNWSNLGKYKTDIKKMFGK